MDFISFSKRMLASAAVLALALPMWARSVSTKTYEVEWTNNQTTKIGAVEVQPGNYSLKAHGQSGSLDVMQDGKMVAQVPCTWITLSKKAVNTEVEVDHNKIVQVEFAGKTEAIEVR